LKKLFFALLLLQAVYTTAQSTQPTAKALIAQMTLEDKVRMLVGKGMRIKMGDMNLKMDNGPAIGQTLDKVPGAAGLTHAIPHLGIPNTVMADGPAGLRIAPVRDSIKQTFYATAFPVASLLACSWDTAVLRLVGRAMGHEAKEYGIDILLTPAFNMHRNPLGGRNFEYYSEDPLLSGWMAAAMVNGIQSQGVGTSVKHFAGNEQETSRSLVNTIASERALREIYLRPFQIALQKSNPWTVMSSYNKLNGPYTSENAELLTSILRKEWHYKGYVVTDWYGGANAVEQVKAGNDLLMPGTPAQVTAILNAVKDGKLSEKQIDENVERILNISFLSPSFKGYAFSNQPRLADNAAIARKAATEGMVLLKNSNRALPIKPGITTIAAFGNTTYDFIVGGTGSGDVNEAYAVSLHQGLSNAGLKINETLQSQYLDYLKSEKEKQPKNRSILDPIVPLAEMPLSDQLINNLAATCQMALLTIGRNAGEFRDRKLENDYQLTDAETQMLSKIAAAFRLQKKPVVVVLNIGGIIDMKAITQHADAILLAWQGGQEGGNAVADILTGRVNPSGKLTSTITYQYEDVPSAKNFPGKNLSATEVRGMGGLSMGYPSEVVYEEGIFLGYRYHQAFNVKPLYPFGHGLSYTNFTYSDIKLSGTSFSNKLTVAVTVTNTGKVAGREIVQLYLTAPATQLPKPVQELKSFAKTKLLNPGEKTVLQFTLTAAELASYNSDATAWIADAGTYRVRIGASSEDLRLQGIFNLKSAIVVEKCSKVLLPQVKINELRK
jgi:beta-glucosidase